jgi:hypothetical protein
MLLGTTHAPYVAARQAMLIGEILAKDGNSLLIFFAPHIVDVVEE